MHVMLSRQARRLLSALVKRDGITLSEAVEFLSHLLLLIKDVKNQCVMVDSPSLHRYAESLCDGLLACLRAPCATGASWTATASSAPILSRCSERWSRHGRIRVQGIH